MPYHEADECMTIIVPAPLRKQLREHAESEGLEEEEWVLYLLRAATDRRERLHAAQAGFDT